MDIRSIRPGQELYIALGALGCPVPQPTKHYRIRVVSAEDDAGSCLFVRFTSSDEELGDLDKVWLAYDWGRFVRPVVLKINLMEE